ncbi:TRAP transporter small permease [Buttiauxella massiliensis]|uniref:TRAP transporter small permease n=1 Tax=Buttiauxella massiliensis TaxID=2831590 RepID=UPI00125EFA77|nr:TRAP transporter small permease [Buttiauxella massiliensis]
MKLITFKSYLDKGIGLLVACLLTALCLIAMWQVFSRYILNDPSTYTEELLRYIMIWMGFLGAVCCFSSQRHLALTLLESKLNIRLRVRLNTVHHVIIMVSIFFVMILGGWQFMLEGMGQRSSTLGIPMGWVHAIIPLSGVLIILLEVINILSNFQGGKSHD